ncbi:MAG: 2Fe-2S iron-sulfur cluster-binding protein [Phycisphaerae bacterium]
MPTITVDGKKVDCREGVPVLRAALEAGMEVPHYCYHPGLSIVASCRLCLMELKMPDPRTKELTWSPRLVPSCQTPVKDGMEVRFRSPGVTANQKHVMEYYLLNHPLDCPVCDKAGECYLQDYTEDFGSGSSRMVEEKHKNPKKDIGDRTLLYQDRCVLCTRCVRFCSEIAGSGELSVVDRGSRAEIDVFPGVPLENKLQGNVVDLCPVGALLDKEFLFKQRVWMLQPAKSICAGCSRGCTIDIEQNQNRIHRVRPRFNEKINEWWICDDGRFGWKHVHDPARLQQPRQKRGGAWEALRWEDAPAVLRARFEQAAAPDGGKAVAAMLSPMLACEEAWLLARFVRSVAPQATVVPGFIPTAGQDETFAKGFVVKAEKCPNRRGIERVIAAMGGPTLSFDEFVAGLAKGAFKAAYISGGYPRAWAPDALSKAAPSCPFLVLHDLLPSALDAAAAIQLPASTWAEREGSFMNCDGLLQAFDRAVTPLEGVKTEGQFFAELAGEPGLYRARKIREKMSAQMAEFATPFVPREEPAYAH